MKQIMTQRELAELARELGTRPDWHEPDEQGLTATVSGTQFDNAHEPGWRWRWAGATDWHAEIHVTLEKDGVPVAVVNLATLFAWATGYREGGE